jgi:hypothetical protein
MREASVKSDFTDEAFKSFLSAPTTVAKAEDLNRALQTWKESNLTAPRAPRFGVPASSRADPRGGIPGNKARAKQFRMGRGR